LVVDKNEKSETSSEKIELETEATSVEILLLVESKLTTLATKVDKNDLEKDSISLAVKDNIKLLSEIESVEPWEGQNRHLVLLLLLVGRELIRLPDTS
jgi:hypothetical protein